MIVRISAVAANTFREAVRDRVLLGMVGATFAMLLFSLALAELALYEQKRVVFDMGLATISLFSVVVSVFLGSALLYKEIERKTLYVILPKPLHRHEFLLGKYFGIVLTGLVFISITGAVQIWVSLAQVDTAGWLLGVTLLGPIAVFAFALWRAKDSTISIIVWSVATLLLMCVVAKDAPIELGPLTASLLLTLGEVAVLSAVALLFSSFSTPFLTGVFTTGVWLLGRSADTMATTKSRLLPEIVKTTLHISSQVLPNFHLFVPGRHTLVTMSDVGGPGTYVFNTMLYAVTYSVVLLACAALVFRKRDFL